MAGRIPKNEKRPLWLKRSFKHILKISLGIESSKAGYLPPSLESFEETITGRVKTLYSELAENDGRRTYKCLLCHRAGFTKRGLYYHFLKVHQEEIEEEILRAVEEKFEASRKG